MAGARHKQVRARGLDLGSTSARRDPALAGGLQGSQQNAGGGLPVGCLWASCGLRRQAPWG